MRTATVKELSTNIRDLLAEVKKGLEVTITDRGKVVARLVPPAPPMGKPFPDLSEFRRRMPIVDPPVSQAVIEERDEGYTQNSGNTSRRNSSALWN
jgi:prevent-host-death family protein